LELELVDSVLVELELTVVDLLVDEEIELVRVLDELDSDLELEFTEDDKLENVVEEELESGNGGNVTFWEVIIEEFVTGKELPCLGTKACDRAKRLRNAMVLAILNERWRNDRK
jgi:hypothetical protein